MSLLPASLIADFQQAEDRKRYIIYWESRITKASGHGSQPLTREQAAAALSLQKDPHLRHWLVPYREHVTFPRALDAVAHELRTVLWHADDPEELEHQAILFWPKLTWLSDWHERHTNEGKAIDLLHTVRAQFLEHPATASILQTLEQAIRLMADAFRSQSDIPGTLQHCTSLLKFP